MSELREAMEALLEGKKVWQYSARQYAAMKGHQPLGIASISPKQMAMGSKQQLKRYMDKRYASSSKSAELQRDYAQAVLRAHLAGEFVWKRNPAVHSDAKSIIVQYLKATEKKAADKKAAEVRKATVLELEDLTKGDRVYVKSIHYDGWAVVVRVLKKAVKVKFDGATEVERVNMYGNSPFLRDKP